MARITTAFSLLELARLLDGLEGTSHLDEDPIDQDFTDALHKRLTCLIDQLTMQDQQPEEAPEGDTSRDITGLVLS
jgi:ribosome assembly protein YihI (activator of Der GTPase)